MVALERLYAVVPEGAAQSTEPVSTHGEWQLHAANALLASAADIATLWKTGHGAGPVNGCDPEQRRQSHSPPAAPPVRWYPIRG
jgi:hypothetical protein